MKKLLCRDIFPPREGLRLLHTLQENIVFACIQIQQDGRCLLGDNWYAVLFVLK